MSELIEIPSRPVRQFLNEDFKITTWDSLKPHFDELSERNIASSRDLKNWLRDRSELESVISEDLGWRYIRMTCYTENDEYRKSYQDFIQNIQPEIAPVSDLLNRKAFESPWLNELAKEPGYDILIRNLKKDIEIFKEVNIPLYTEINTETQKYGQLSGAMTVEIDGKELTLQQAGVLLLSADRTKREEAFRKITTRRLQDKTTMDELYSKLIGLRHKVSLNAGFANFRDYMFKSYARFDYTPQHCFPFPQPIQSKV